MAKKVAEKLPEEVALFYLRDNKEVVVASSYYKELFLSNEGDFIRVK